jgi:hypothetical protein
MAVIKKIIKNVLPYYFVEKYRGKRKPSKDWYPVELTENEKRLIDYVFNNNLTLVSWERLLATLMSCKYILDNNLDGDFVECGVWRGGNSIIAKGIFEMYHSNKKVYMYDTFQGMTTPTEEDVELRNGGVTAKQLLAKDKLDKTKNWTPKGNVWAYASIDDVKSNFTRFGLSLDNVEFVQGDVVQTLEKTIPGKISVLRIDTDWYESTKKEMEVLYKQIVTNGVFMVDDYGHWGGSKKAVDEYFEENGRRPFLQYIDYTGRLGIKTR